MWFKPFWFIEPGRSNWFNSITDGEQQQSTKFIASNVCSRLLCACSNWLTVCKGKARYCYAFQDVLWKKHNNKVILHLVVLVLFLQKWCGFLNLVAQFNSVHLIKLALHLNVAALIFFYFTVSQAWSDPTSIQSTKLLIDFIVR